MFMTANINHAINMRRYLPALVAFVLLMTMVLSLGSTALASPSEEFAVEVVCNCWSRNTSMGGSSLYTPYLKLNVTNQKTSSVSRVVLKVVFYDEAKKSLWSDETEYLVSSSDDPLKSGYKKTAYVRSSVGYRSQPSVSSLPSVTADVYINDQYYGSIAVNCSYSETSVSQKLTKNTTSGSSTTTEFDTDDPFGVKVTAAYWTAYTGYTGQTLYVPYVKVQVTNQQSTPASKINVKVVFIDDKEKSVWDDEKDYLITSSDTPLKVGYNKTAYIRAAVGYTRQISTSSLPAVTAEVYVNDEYYGKVSIRKTYSEESLSIVLKKEKASTTESTVAVDQNNPYKVTVVANCWKANQGSFGGTTLYTPYLKLNVLNQSGEPLKRASLKVVFYNEKEKIVWSDESDSLVSSSDSPVQHGYSKTSFVWSSVGYRSQVSESSLPDLTAEIYLNDEYIGTVKINKTYTEKSLTDVVKKDTATQSSTTAQAGDEPFEVYVITNCWAANTGTTTLYTPYLKLKVMNTQGKPASKINMQVVFYDEA